MNLHWSTLFSTFLMTPTCLISACPARGSGFFAGVGLKSVVRLFGYASSSDPEDGKGVKGSLSVHRIRAIRTSTLSTDLCVLAFCPLGLAARLQTIFEKLCGKNEKEHAMETTVMGYIGTAIGYRDPFLHS